MKFGASFGLHEQFWVHAHLETSSESVSLRDWALKANLADLPDCTRWGRGEDNMDVHAFYFCEGVYPFCRHVEEYMAHIDPKQLELLDVVYVVDNVEPPWKGEKRTVFLAIQALDHMVIWTTQKKGVYDGAQLFDHYLIFF